MNMCFISTPKTWMELTFQWKNISDEELFRRAHNPDGSVRTEQYMAGDYDKWNKAADRKQGDLYYGVCREMVILNQRKDEQRKTPRE